MGLRNLACQYGGLSHSISSKKCWSLTFELGLQLMHITGRLASSGLCTGVGTGGPRGPVPPPPLGKKGGASSLFPPPPPLFMVYLSLSCHTLGSTALALVCVRGHFRVLENEKFSTSCEGKPLPHPPQLGRSASSYGWPPFLNMLLRLCSLLSWKYL